MSDQAHPPWLVSALKDVGQREIVGARHNPLIVNLWIAIRAPFRDDETPWCAAFVGAHLERAGIRSTRSGLARSYHGWGRTLDNNFPRVGCIATFWRGRRDGPYGHVGFVLGRDRFGRVVIVSGNANNKIGIDPYTETRLLGYAWPDTYPLPPRESLPLVNSSGQLVQSEQ